MSHVLRLPCLATTNGAHEERLNSSEGFAIEGRRRGKAVERKAEDAEADERAGVALERMLEDARRAVRGE
jgi:hypothetical protein